MRDGIIPVVSENNPYLNLLELHGIDKENLKKIFTGEQISWGEVLGNDASERVSVFIPEKGKGYTKKWADFLEIDAALMQAERFRSREALLDSLNQNPYIIAVLNACCAYDPGTNERIDGIVALAIDIDNNGRIDRNEEINDDLCDLQRALYLGLRPSTLCSCIFLQAEQPPVDIEQLTFIKWILSEGQKHVADHGFSVIRHSMADKAIQDLENQMK
jgi:phosphate transport system substrate-binding protein